MGNYTIFAETMSGMEVVHQIEVGRPDPGSEIGKLMTKQTV